MSEIVRIVYTNWRNEKGERLVHPKKIWFGSTEWHKEPQWLMTAMDVEKNEMRDFAMKDIESWTSQ